MNIFKHPGKELIYGIDNLKENELIALYNVTINYKSYLQELLKQPDQIMLQMAPGMSAKIVRKNLTDQDDACTKFIEMWNTVIKAAGVNKKQN